MKEFFALTITFLLLITASVAHAADPACMTEYRKAGYNIGYEPDIGKKTNAMVIVGFIPLPVQGRYIDFGFYDRTFRHTRALHQPKGDLATLAGSTMIFGAVDHPTAPSYLVGVQADGSCVALPLTRKKR